MSEVVEINRIEDLASYRLLWNSLLPQTRGASFFHSLDWLESYWRHFGQDQKLRVLIVYSQGHPIGIVPLTIICEKTKIGNIRVLTYPLHDWGWFYGVIGPNPTATLVLAMKYLRRTPREWDMLDLRWTNTDCHDFGRTQRAMQTAGFQGNQGIWATAAVVDFSGTLEDYLATRTTKFRNNYRRSNRRFEELGEVEHIRYRPLGAAHNDGDPAWDLFDSCLDIAARSWQGSSTTGTTLSHESVREFFRETHSLAAKAGMLDINLLTHRNRPIAFGYNYHNEGYVSGLRVGYDPEYSKVGLGNLIYAKTIEDGFQRGDLAFDMGPGYLKLKQPWITHLITSYRYTHYSNIVPKVQLIRMKHWWNRRRSAKQLHLAG